MSKNVAVFVDVANIFYAAKAAGVDIDYVTLLRSATAGRDLVRAYAYTGLDPDNDNQLKFHDFLRKSGFKVVSKDIRKYGDGRVKANLDIELVVDLMRLAQHIDIAVVVSGDGDFAPAIRAVQQMGVRVDVISFSGNTSSDLKEVADDFYEITQLARVEKGARSGRRVAAEAEDDLSMTAVPEKETDNGPRRRRGVAGRGRDRDRDERGGRDRGERADRGERGERADRPAREPRVAAAAVAAAPSVEGGLPSNVIVLPGERLSRAPLAEASADVQDGPDEDESLEAVEVADAVEAGDGAADGEEQAGDGRRRRRRRGGRGRGRGRRPEDGSEDGQASAAASEGADADDTFLEEELPALPQHSTFGSVWDTQIGLPAQPVAAASDVDEEEYDDEPEIPEYLLAERRQQGRGGQRGGRGGQRGGRGGQRSGYQSAIDRERFGRSGPAMFAGQGGGNRSSGGDRGRGGDRSRGGSQGAGSQGGGRRSAQPAPAPRDRDVAPVTASTEPWSEVPAEVQELLRAEMARRGGSRPAAATAAPEAAPAARGSRRSPRSAATAAGPSAEPSTPVVTEAPAAEEAPRPVRRRTTRAATPAEPVTDAAAAADGTPAPAPAEEAPKPVRRRTTRPAAPAEPAES